MRPASVGCGPLSSQLVSSKRRITRSGSRHTAAEPGASYAANPSLQSRQFVGTGFHADSDVLYTASTKFLDVKNYVFAIAAGAAGDLAASAGMAGDNSPAHDFAPDSWAQDAREFPRVPENTPGAASSRPL